MSGALPDQNRYLHRVTPTPLVPLRLDEGQPVVWCKLEFLNPSGSTKDRIARFILEKAWRQGRLGPGDLVVEASSGSTSIALALASAQMGLRFLAVMPEGVSSERVLIIRAYGGEVKFTPAAEGIRGAIAETHRLAGLTGAFLPRQFENHDNAEAHRLGTAREIVDQAPGGQVDAVVSGVGTGGTLVGLFRGLSESGCRVVPVLARPVNVRAAPEAECCSFSSRIPGVADSISVIFEQSALPGLVTVEVNDAKAIAMTRRLIRMGFPVGPSSGLNITAALEVARKNGWQRVVTVFPDRMERYFTTELFKPFQETEGAVPAAGTVYSNMQVYGEMKPRGGARDLGEW
jgi:cysteine synthase A